MPVPLQFFISPFSRGRFQNGSALTPTQSLFRIVPGTDGIVISGDRRAGKSSLGLQAAVSTALYFAKTNGNDAHVSEDPHSSSSRPTAPRPTTAQNIITTKRETRKDNDGHCNVHVVITHHCTIEEFRVIRKAYVICSKDLMGPSSNFDGDGFHQRGDTGSTGVRDGVGGVGSTVSSIPLPPTPFDWLIADENQHETDGAATSTPTVHRLQEQLFQNISKCGKRILSPCTYTAADGQRFDGDNDPLSNIEFLYVSSFQEAVRTLLTAFPAVHTDTTTTETKTVTTTTEPNQSEEVISDHDGDHPSPPRLHTRAATTTSPVLTTTCTETVVITTRIVHRMDVPFCIVFDDGGLHNKSIPSHTSHNHNFQHGGHSAVADTSSLDRSSVALMLGALSSVVQWVNNTYGGSCPVESDHHGPPNGQAAFFVYVTNALSSSSHHQSRFQQTVESPYAWPLSTIPLHLVVTSTPRAVSLPNNESSNHQSTSVVFESGSDDEQGEKDVADGGNARHSRCFWGTLVWNSAGDDGVDNGGSFCDGNLRDQSGGFTATTLRWHFTESKMVLNRVCL